MLALVVRVDVSVVVCVVVILDVAELVALVVAVVVADVVATHAGAEISVASAVIDIPSGHPSCAKHACESSAFSNCSRGL